MGRTIHIRLFTVYTPFTCTLIWERYGYMGIDIGIYWWLRRIIVQNTHMVCIIKNTKQCKC